VVRDLFRSHHVERRAPHSGVAGSTLGAAIYGEYAMLFASRLFTSCLAAVTGIAAGPRGCRLASCEHTYFVVGKFHYVIWRCHMGLYCRDLSLVLNSPADYYEGLWALPFCPFGTPEFSSVPAR